MPVLSKRIILDCFYLLLFYFDKFSTDVCRLPYAVNVNLKRSFRPKSQLFRLDLSLFARCLFVVLKSWNKERSKRETTVSVDVDQQPFFRENFTQNILKINEAIVVL